MLHEHAIASLKNYVASAFKAGTAHFPYYTLHGAEHLDELDRLAQLVGGELRLPEEDLALLRLAVPVHDYIMAAVPGEEREGELRREFGDIPLTDLIREVHQDETTPAFAEPPLIDYLTGMIPEAYPALLEDVFAIARHHRRHPLVEAPVHLRGLCALMRIVDELDIGPRRAPLPTYEALRTRMPPIAKLHWLKHICARPVHKGKTFASEDRGTGKVLKIFVVVYATPATWEPLEEIITGKLRACLDEEQVNRVLRETLQAEFTVGASRSLPSGATGFLSSVVREDLGGLEALAREESRRYRPAATLPAAAPPSAAPDPSATPMATRPPHAIREFKVRAIPPERLAELLCESGKLTVIRNAYIAPEEETIGGAVGAPSRFYVGPADSGKTRAALEWIGRLVGQAFGQWVIFRADGGILPADSNAIVLDCSLYGDHELPSKGVLFLDDLPLNLPLSGSGGGSAKAADLDPPSPEDGLLPADRALSDFLRWFRELPYLREQRVVGTLRSEEIRGLSRWPEVLPTLGQELELIHVQPLDSAKYADLWVGMAEGAVSHSITRGIESFSMTLEPAFVEAVTRRPTADPEAVATFVQQRALGSGTRLVEEDAAAFSASAVDTWLRETWPAIEKAYGVAARVFFTLARFLEARLRSSSGLLVSMGPDWAYHERWGPELCALHGGAPGAYLPTLAKLVEDGHAVGNRGGSIRPRLDYLLQAEILPGIELAFPEPAWLLQRTDGLQPSGLHELGAHLASSDPAAPAPHDAELLVGWSLGLMRSAANPAHESDRAALLERAIAEARKAVEMEPLHAVGWNYLGQALGMLAGEMKSAVETAELWQRAYSAFRKSVEAGPGDSHAWAALGFSLVRSATARGDSLDGTVLEEAIAAFRQAVQLDPDDSGHWHRLGLALSQKARAVLEGDERFAGTLGDEAIAAFHAGILREPRDGLAWYNLGLILKRRGQAGGTEADGFVDQAITAFRNAGQYLPDLNWCWFHLAMALRTKAEREQDIVAARRLRAEALEALRRAAQLDPNEGAAWYQLGIELTLKADEDRESDAATALRDEAINAFRSAVHADRSQAWPWYLLGAALGRQASHEERSGNASELRDQEIEAYVQAVSADPKLREAWFALALRLGTMAGKQGDTATASALRDREIAAYHELIALGPGDVSIWHNLGLSLGIRADESDPLPAKALRDEAIAALRKAVELDPTSTTAWRLLALTLGDRADRETDTIQASALRDEEIDAYHQVLRSNPDDGWVLYNLGISLGERAELEGEPIKAMALRSQEIDAHREAARLLSQEAASWSALTVSLVNASDVESDPVKASALRRESITTARKLVDIDRDSAESWATLAEVLEKAAAVEADPSRAAELREESLAASREAKLRDPGEGGDA